MEEEIVIEEKAVKQKTIETNVKDVVGLLPLITTIVFTLGLLKLFFYYKHFNVPISYFLQISELGLIISEDLLIVLIITIYYFLFYLDNELSVLKWVKKIKFIFKVIITICLMIVGIYTLIDLIQTSSYSEVLVDWGTLALILICFEIIATREFIFLPEFLFKYKPIIILIIFPFSVILLDSGLAIHSVEHGKYKGTFITTSDTTYRSNDTSYFIGKTADYVFIYNKFDTTTFILPTNQITKMKIKINEKTTK